MRFCVRRLDVCPGEERRTLRKSAFWRHDLTERRILAARSHGKAHSGGTISRKDALCGSGGDRLRLSVRCWGQTALFREAQRADCAFPSGRRPEGAQGNRPPECGALWKMAQLGKCARATARQAAGQVAPSDPESLRGAHYHCALPLRTIVIASKHPKRAPALLLRVPQRSHAS